MANINAEIIKTDNMITTGGITAAGLLTAEQGNQFVYDVFKLSGLMDKVTTARFTSSTRRFSKLSLDQRVVFPKAEGVSVGRQSRVVTSDVELTAFRYVVEVEVSYEFIQQNIQNGNITDVLMGEFAKAIGNDLERFALNGNALGHAQYESFIDAVNGSSTKMIKDPLLSKGDGWLKKADSGNIFDAENADKISKVIAGMKKQMPDQYKLDPRLLRFIMPQDLVDNYIYQLSGRNTLLGDKMQTGMMQVEGFSVPLLGLPLFDVRPYKVKHVTLTGTTAAALDYENIVDTEVYVTPSTLDTTPITPYTLTTDYEINEANGTIARPSSGSAISSGATVKVSYKVPPEILLTDPTNLLIGMNTDDITIERERNISKQTWKFVISGSISANVLRTDAIVKAINVQDDLEAS